MEDRLSNDPEFWEGIEALKAENEPTINAVVDYLYDDLRDVAHRIMWQEGEERTIQPTALLHDAYRRLQAASNPIRWKGAEYAKRLFARTMRRVLIEEARKRKALKRDGSQVPPAWVVFRDYTEIELDTILDIDRLLQELRTRGLMGVRQSDVMEMILFSQAEQFDVAHELGITVRQVQKDWADGRYWLAKRMA
ncbi:MAG: ECF-type sigma factor [Candidatus Eisenbacteria bacterium]